MLMVLVKDNKPLAAECAAQIDRSDALMSGFMDGKYFEISDFSFGVDLTDDDAKETKEKDKDGNEIKVQKGSKFTRWKTSTGKMVRPYEVNLEEFSFSRQIDIASPILFQSCFRSKSFDSAAVVKRKAGGVSGGHGIAGMPFFRIDFSDVLLVSLDWEIDDAVVREKCKFICREVSVQYRPQLANGSPGDVVPSTLLSLVKRSS
jgi:type VI protein secretion system component Hcp